MDVSLHHFSNASRVGSRTTCVACVQQEDTLKALLYVVEDTYDSPKRDTMNLLKCGMDSSLPTKHFLTPITHQILDILPGNLPVQSELVDISTQRSPSAISRNYMPSKLSLRICDDYTVLLLQLDKPLVSVHTNPSFHLCPVNPFIKAVPEKILQNTEKFVYTLNVITNYLDNQSRF